MSPKKQPATKLKKKIPVMNIAGSTVTVVITELVLGKSSL